MKKFTKQLELKLKKLGIYTRANECLQDGELFSGEEGTEVGDICSAFDWEYTDEGGGYWNEIDDITLEMPDVVTKNVIGGKLL